MRCLACNKELTDKEASRKYENHEDIKNPEEKFIGLCSKCSYDTDYDDVLLSHELLDEDVFISIP